MYTFEELRAVREKVKGMVKPKRFEHILGVAYTAACMAMFHGTDPLTAEMAGLLHDCAKCFSNEELISKCASHDIPLSKEELASPQVIHAKYGSFLAASKFGIKDADVLNAIRYHTTGRPEMSVLEKIVFVADFIEPLRDKASNLAEARRLAFSDLDECVYNILKSTVEYLGSEGAMIVPDTLNAYEWYSAKRRPNGD